MLKIRRVEEALASKYADQKMRCPMHLCIGQEAISAGVCEELLPRDMIYSNHRAHGHYLAKGGNLDAMIAELYGKSTGCCGGRGGSMHLIDKYSGNKKAIRYMSVQFKIEYLGADPAFPNNVNVDTGQTTQSTAAFSIFNGYFFN